MADENKNSDQKRTIPGGFLLFLLAIVLVVLTFQNLSSEKNAKVAFSYELEHLVNLDLLIPQASKKIALKDNLVTFSGQFQDQLSEEAKMRFRYLQLLAKNHQINEESEEIRQRLGPMQAKAQESATEFLHISGIPIPKGGYVVVDPSVDTPSRSNAVIIQHLSPGIGPNLPILEHEYARMGTSSSAKETYGKELLLLIQRFRSPVLGIGNETVKQQLKGLEQTVADATSGRITTEQQLATYQNALIQLRGIVDTLNTQEQGIRLGTLRSVRSYASDLARYTATSEALDVNSAELDKARQAVAATIWFFNDQELSTKALERQDPELFNNWFVQAQKAYDTFSANKGLAFKTPDQPRNLVLEKTFTSEEPSPNYFSYFLTMLPVLMVVLLLYFVFSRQMKGVGSNALSFGKSPAKLLTKERNKVTFRDVAGCDEAKEELMEVVDFLKDPAKFTALGARIPKGVLLVGAPGTGKTLIAKAVAGEADRPFFSISGSDFVEMFVGVGASRIRDMFEQAKKHAPCIIFMDEIDAVGRHRGAGIGGGHDEREQTLNQLLVELDGFDTSEGVILIAATNRPDVLDKALLRPGRFDRRIVIDLPDVKGRLDILKVHARRIKLDSSVDLMNIARSTPGASGADLMNILNESALLAARKGRTAVTAQDADEACDKVRYGKERRSLEIDANEKTTTAFHESGHAIVALSVKHADPVDKVTIIPRGLSLGATHFMPKKNRLSYWKKELLDQLAVLMGGRAAEELFVGDISSGAQMDITQATRLVRSMVCEWGMTESLGLVSYDERSESGQFLGMPSYHEKNYSEDTAKSIDEEVRKLLDEAHRNALAIVEANRSKIQLMTDMLIEFETLDRDDVKEIMDGTWDIEKKRKRLQSHIDAHRTLPPPSPPKKEPVSSISTQPQQT